MRTLRIRARKLSSPIGLSNEQLKTNNYFCYVYISHSGTLRENNALFSVFFPLWGHIHPYTYRGASKWRTHISHFLSRRKPPQNRATMTHTTSLSNLLQWAAQLIAMLLEILFLLSVIGEGQTQKALTFGRAKASTLNPTTMKTSDQCAETSDANHLPTKGCRTIAWAIAADISQLLWQQVLPREQVWWSSPEWVRRQ